MGIAMRNRKTLRDREREISKRERETSRQRKDKIERVGWQENLKVKKREIL